MRDLSKKIFLLISLSMINQPPLKALNIDRDAMLSIAPFIAVGVLSAINYFSDSNNRVTPEERERIQQSFKELAGESSKETTEDIPVLEAAETMTDQLRILEDRWNAAIKSVLEPLIAQPDFFGYSENASDRVEQAEALIRGIHQDLILDEETAEQLESNTQVLFALIRGLWKAEESQGAIDTSEDLNLIKETASAIQNIYKREGKKATVLKSKASEITAEQPETFSDRWDAIESVLDPLIYQPDFFGYSKNASDGVEKAETLVKEVNANISGFLNKDAAEQLDINTQALFTLIRELWKVEESQIHTIDVEGDINLIKEAASTIRKIYTALPK